ncbi:hypothetical protein [Endozoicomonas sp. ALB091]|uniref:hypothetical protein n=1 Tax=Endozoicomonas sp. ALB091 TaxID=3403073 RepID=UPI003BB4983C
MEQLNSLEKHEFIRHAMYLLGMAMETPKGVDMFVEWYGHVDALHVFITHNALYVNKKHKDYDEERERHIYRTEVRGRGDEPVKNLIKTINECQQVLDKLKQEQEVA